MEQATLPILLVNPPKLTYKIAILGNADCGKTTLIYRLVHGALPEQSEPTAGVGYSNYTLHIADEDVRCQIWDIAGQERFGALVPIYIRDTDLCLIALSMNEDSEVNRASLQHWICVIKSVALSSRIVVVGTKCDLPNTDGTEVDVLTSSLLGIGVSELEQAMASQISTLRLSKPIAYTA